MYSAVRMCLRTRSAPAPTRPLRSRAVPLVLPLAFLAAAASAAAAEPCKVSLIGELPVTMEGMRPIVHAAINGTDESFIADSGAFYSMLTTAAAAQLHLRLEPAPSGYLMGLSGPARVSMTTARTFTIFKVDVHDVEFLVGSNELHPGTVGLLGQNVFRIGDVEYDLANGAIRLLKAQGDCGKASLAYWANSKGLPYSEIDIDFATRMAPHTMGTAYVNGSRIRVMFDTGADGSMLGLNAAKRAGVTPDSAGVRPGGGAGGIGTGVIRTWIAPFASFKIGDEEIRNTHLRIGDEALSGTDMLIGADFFLSHHVLVASSQRKLYFTYNGGPVFNLTTMPESATGAAAPATAAAAEPPAPSPVQAAAAATPEESLDAAGYARRGSASASRRDYEHAIADLTRAIELAPGEADYFYGRGMARWRNKEEDKALEDFGQAIKLNPAHVSALMARSELRAERHDPAGIIRPDLDAVDRAVPGAADARLTLGHLYESVGDYPAAIAQLDRWIDARDHNNAKMPFARNARCRARALAGQELERALTDCNAAVSADPKEAAFHDCRGLVYLRQGRYDKAIADYDAALALNPKIAWALYGRGLAKQHQGQAAAGQADMAAATTLAPRIAEEAASHGLVP
jgi:tetratricopeptide (TPR) repeat protein/predicted aspartyl protease